MARPARNASSEAIFTRIFGSEEEPQGLKARFFLFVYGTTKQAAEKRCAGQESNASGAKARRILNRLRPD
jgi:hypothetical protein